MSYSLWSRGRLLGTTELAYVRCMPLHRMGDLNATDCADILAAADRGEPVLFELRGPDGEVIPTRHIGIRDTERLLALAAEAERDAERETWDDPEVDVELALGVGVEFDPTRAYDEGELAEPQTDFHHELEELEDLEPREFPRWQIVVTLLDDASIP